MHKRPDAQKLCYLVEFLGLFMLTDFVNLLRHSEDSKQTGTPIESIERQRLRRHHINLIGAAGFVGLRWGHGTAT